MSDDHTRSEDVARRLRLVASVQDDVGVTNGRAAAVLDAADLIERQAKVVEAARLLNSFPTINLDEYEQINAFDSVTAALSAFDDLEAE